MTIIEAHGLTRTFTSRRRSVEAVRGVDLTVTEGEIVGFLGPNGAGKPNIGIWHFFAWVLLPLGGAQHPHGARDVWCHDRDGDVPRLRPDRT